MYFRSSHSLAALFVLFCSLFTGLSYLRSLSGYVGLFWFEIIWYIGFCLLYLIILRLYARSENLEDLKFLVLASILGRLVVAIAPVVLTGDLARYLWEASLIRQGLNPYLLPPDSPALLGLRNQFWDAIEYKHLSAIYPPVAQYFLGLFAGSILSWKLTLCCFEMLSFLCILKILKASNKPAGHLLYYACLPLSIIEIAGSGHLEGILLSLMLSFYLLFQNLKQARAVWQGILLGLLASMTLFVKYNAALFLLLVGSKDWQMLYRREFQIALISSLVFSLLFFWPFLDPKLSVFQSLQVYIEHWRFNDSLLHFFGTLAGVNWQDSFSFSPLKLSLVFLWGLTCLIMSQGNAPAIEIAAYSYFSYLLVSAVVHPWYGLWFAIFLPFVSSKALVCMALTLPISYTARLQDRSEVSVEVKLLEYLPVLILFGFEAWKSTRLRNALHS